MLKNRFFPLKILWNYSVFIIGAVCFPIGFWTEILIFPLLQWVFSFLNCKFTDKLWKFLVLQANLLVSTILGALSGFYLYYKYIAYDYNGYDSEGLLLIRVIIEVGAIVVITMSAYFAVKKRSANE